MSSSVVAPAIQIDVDTHFLPRVDPGSLQGFLPVADGTEVAGTLAKELFRLADPRTVRASLEQPNSSAAPSAHRDPVERAKAMEGLGFDVQVLIPDGPYLNPYGSSPLGNNPSLELRSALCRLYNNASAGAQREFPNKFIGTAVVPFDDVEASVAEVDRVVNELGLRVIVIPANWVGRNYDAIELYPFWRKAADLEAVLFVHHIPQGCGGAINDHPPYYPMLGMERMRRLHVGTYLGFGLEYMMACAALTLGGVLDEFPSLRFCFFEAGASWLPYAMYACDRAFLIEPQCSRTRVTPSELILEHCFSAVEPTEHIEQLVAMIGHQNFFFGSDFPHPEYQRFHSTPEAILSREGLPDEAKPAILGTNIARVLKFRKG